MPDSLYFDCSRGPGPGALGEGRQEGNAERHLLKAPYIARRLAPLAARTVIGKRGFRGPRKF